MQKLTLLLVFVIAIGSCKSQTDPGQDTEFNQNPNGLIYSEQDIKALRFVVDSLNLKFKTCDLNRNYLADFQVKAFLIRFESKTNNLKSIISAIKANATPSALIKQNEFFLDKTDSNILVVATHMDEDGKQQYISGNAVAGFDSEYMLAGKKTISLKGWQFDYSPKDDYTDHFSLDCLYFPVVGESITIPAQYGRLIQYVDCMVDTSATVFLTGKLNDTEGDLNNWKADQAAYKKAELEKLRRTRVVGMCSQDQSPRIHALKIAKLAAETHSWDIFLRSHLDIMNDRFERMSDGSYAWGKRKTYIRELEALDINVIDMMLGLTLRAANNAGNHYNGTVWRIGKALSESKDRLLFEQKVTAMMKDETLDEFNRSLMFFLYNVYLDYLEDKNERKEKVNQMKNETAAYPAFLQWAIGEMKSDGNKKD